jgi:Domain of Unknown Function (DUF1206)
VPGQSVRRAIEGFVRLGYVAKGVVYLLIGALALRVAAGLHGGRLTDPGGALYVVLRRPMGHALLIAIAVGLLAYAGWQIAGAIFGWDRHGRAGYLVRALTVVRAAVYGAIGVQAMKLAVGLRGSHVGPEPLVRAALHWPFGAWLVLLAGIGSACYGIVQVRDAINGHLEPDLDAHTLRRCAGDWALQLARAGIVARALVLFLLALGVIRAAIVHRASAAGGMDASLVILNSMPQGTFLLGATAAGLLAYGVYQFLHARFASL